MTARPAPAPRTRISGTRISGTRISRTLLAVALAGTLAACGGGGDDTVAADASPTALSCPIEAKEVEAPAGATTDLKTKPVIAPGKGPAPKDLQYSDIVVGEGDEAQTGDQVQVKYVGALYETGKEFDSSWSRGPDETLPFGICRQGVVPGFAVGPSGMKVGGRRQIVLPPEYGYGAQGSPPAIPPNSTLVFVVDLVEVG
ncbi:MAG: FKBP-type peptidyl-prolyl cis-trans isomerase FkpA precursor [uncultured Frankineae bacterium]|uniref:Peptidyl-prolyl cis-trans isomerase n=1 Tax=uncultured Frankineae bacterium TaxID=437475 RepID=A0A6J4M357_9ACTN|nr:MAG: FKBP-type peptidyl-prolyl cis-trans isomerase FkpA precursor [uncultured Frankineae bacterium]